MPTSLVSILLLVKSNIIDFHHYELVLYVLQTGSSNLLILNTCSKSKTNSDEIGFILATMQNIDY